MSDDFSSPELLDDFVMPNAAGGRKKSIPVQMSVTRELTKEDLLALVDGSDVAGEKQQHSSILKIRNSHHQLARHIAAGTSMTEVAEITGYSPAYISVLKGDPAFKDLLQHYENERKEIFIDTVERARNVSILALEELQERLIEDPDSFKHRELMDVAQLGIGAEAGKKSSPSNGGAAGGIVINFVSPPDAQPLIDITPTDEE